MQILKEGKAHKLMAWFTECSICKSELKILEGDPWSTSRVCYNCDRRQYFIRYICPVCKSMEVAYTNSAFGETANAKYEEIFLKKEDRDDIESWSEREVLSEEESEWINNRLAP